MDKILELRSDIQKVIDAIDNEIDAYITSFEEKHPARRGLARSIYLVRKQEAIEITKKMVKKYG